MRIEGTTLGKVEEKEHKPKELQQSLDGVAHTSAESKPGDVVVLAPSVSKLVAEFNREAQAQAEKVAQVRRQVNRGDYQVDHKRLAEKMVNEELHRDRK